MIKISRQEWKFVGLIGIIVIFLTFLPFLVGYFMRPGGSVFLFQPMMNYNDFSVYCSYMEQVKSGSFLFKNLFTPEAHSPFIFNPFWLLMGIFAKIFSLPGFIAFHLGRLLLIPPFLALSYYFVSFFFEEENKRKICYLFFVFASGFSVFFADLINNSENILSENIPMDLFVPEGFTFLSLYNTPHFIASLSLIILIFLFSLFLFERHKLIYSLLAGFFALFLFSFHPYHVITIFGVLFAFIFINLIMEKKINFDYFRHYFILLVFSLIPIFYYLWTINKVWVRHQHFLQNITLTPSLSMVFISYGFLIPLALVGIFYITKKEKNKKTFFWQFGRLPNFC